MAQLHIAPDDTMKRCVAQTISSCHYGGPVAMTLARGKDKTPASQRHLPLGTSGTTSRGGASRNIEELIDKHKTSPEIIRYVQRKERRWGRISTTTSEEGQVLAIDNDSWNAMSVEEREQHIQARLENVHEYLQSSTRNKLPYREVIMTVEDNSLKTVEAERGTDAKPRVVIGRTFLKTASLDAVWKTLGQAYGGVLAGSTKRNSPAWRSMMHRAGIPTDFVYRVSPAQAFPYIAACFTCNTGSYRPTNDAAECKKCRKNSKTSQLTIKENPQYAG